MSAGPIWRASPNFGPRRGGVRPVLIVLHYTAMHSADAALERLCDRRAEVSAHYLIGCDGRLWQLVEESQRAWHAGAGQWGACDDVNSASVGIELDNRGNHPFAAAQMDVVERLVCGIMARWAIPPRGVIAHSDLAPGRKDDPGARFDWARLARRGLAAAPARGAPSPPDAERFAHLLRRAGYTAAADHETLLRAFRLRHRQAGTGALCADDMAIASGLADTFG